ncbi:hypothetical protein B0H14DRAFT_2604921 [Mycena olivaceomarginata]|nr:hypothetical protein B0H14DRAFT_2604921 [Mycena olivaceomarginata]
MQWVGSMTSSPRTADQHDPCVPCGVQKAGAAGHARPRTATIWLRERMVGIMLAPMSISTSADTVAISFPPHIALTTHRPGSSADERPGSVYWGRGLIVGDGLGVNAHAAACNWNSRSATGGKAGSAEQWQAVAGSADVPHWRQDGSVAMSAAVADAGGRIPACSRGVVGLNKTGILVLFQIMYTIYFTFGVAVADDVKDI